MILCYVTDRKALPGSGEEQLRAVMDKIEDAGCAGVDWVQIREKDLSPRELWLLAEEARRRVPASCRILINDRLDVAVSCGAAGVHLSEHSVPVEDAARFVREKNATGKFLVGRSTHSVESVKQAAAAGASYVIFGPVFDTPSKRAYGPAQGIERLAEACRAVSMPVLAIGGITVENAKDCRAAGGGGIAGIRLFQESADIRATVQALRRS